MVREKAVAANPVIGTDDDDATPYAKRVADYIAPTGEYKSPGTTFKHEWQVVTLNEVAAGNQEE